MKNISLVLLVLLCLCGCNNSSVNHANRQLHGSGKGLGDGTGSAGGPGKAAKKGSGPEIVLFAAASTHNACEKLIAEFTKDKDVNFKVNYASSGQLASQLLHGAPADIFISANIEWMDSVEKDGLLYERKNLLGNNLVLVVPNDNPLGIAKPEDLLRKDLKRVAMADTNSVPAGMYAKESLMNLSLWDEIKPKIVSGANVRTTLAFVEQGEVLAGIVYSTDAAISDKVKEVYTFPESSHPEIEYPVGLVKASRDNGLARKFYRELSGEKAQQIFSEFGFNVKGIS